MNDITVSSHPSVDKLRRFGLGQMDEAEASVIEEHVSQCDACTRTLANVGPDTFIDALRIGSRILPLGSPTINEGSELSPPAAGHQTLAESSPSAGLPPELLWHPRYRVLALIGSGGMGAVYKAEHRLMERVVALKVMARTLVGNTATVERFRREFKASACLSHPNIVTSYDAEQAGDLHFLVMEYVDGTDLARWLAERGPLPTAEACDYVRQAALGLQHAHEHGMIHRDIKPHNLMRSRDGIVKILDFGLARLAAEAGPGLGGTTGQGTLLGTVDYLAPEQADDAHQADIRSDIYSLGCTLYHLVSGQPPFPRGTLVQKIVAHTERRPQPLRELRPNLPPGLTAVIDRMMAKAPAERYQTPAEVCAALTPFAGRAAVPETPRDREAPPPVRGSRSRGWLVAAAALLLGLAGLAAGVAVYRVQTDNGELIISTDNPDVEVVIRQNGKLVRIIDTKTGKEVRLDSGFYELELRGPAEGLKLSPDMITIHRGQTVVARVERRPKFGADKLTEVRRLEGHTGSVRAAVYSSDGKRILSCSGPPQSDKTVRLWDVATGKQIQQFVGHTDQVDAVALSPDGSLAVSSSRDATVRFWDVASGKEIRQLRGAGWVVALAFSPDGNQILTGSWDKTARLWNAATGEEIRRFEGHTAPVQGVAFAPDGKTLATGSWDTTVRLWDAASGKELRTLEGHTDHVHSVAFSPDGKRLLSAGLDQVLRLWDTQTGKELKKFEGHTARINGLAFSPDGSRALSVGHDNSMRLWDVASGKEVCPGGRHTLAVWSVAFSPKGDYAVSAGADAMLRLWRLPAPPKQTAVVAVPVKPALLYAIPWRDESQRIAAHIYHTGISPDGRLFFGAGDAGRGGNVRVFELATGKLVRDIVLGEDTGDIPYTFARFAGGSKYLVVGYRIRNDLYVWDIATGKLARKLVGHTEPDPRFAVSPNGKQLLSWAEDKTVRLWDVETGKELRKLEGHTDKAAGVFSPDGKQVLTFSPDRTLRLWDVDGGKELKKLEGHTDACIGCFSPDGKQALSYGPDGTVRLWDLGTGKEVRRFDGPTAAVGFAGFVAHGRFVVARGEEHGTDLKHRMWETATGKLISEIDLPQYAANSWTFTASPDGRLALVSVKTDASVRVLELPGGKEIHRFDSCPAARFWSFAPDGSLAVAGSFRAGMYVFRLPAPKAKKAGEGHEEK